MFLIKRIYEKYSSGDGYRVLVDRLWPRGVSKEKAHLDLWLKDIAPSESLRDWFNHDPKKWSSFRKKYSSELKSKITIIEFLRAKERKNKKVTLLFAAENTEENNAVVLNDFLNRGPKFNPQNINFKEGITAPDFELPDENGAWQRLSEYKGKWVLLYFYPKDDTPGCTKEACLIRDYFPDFSKLKAKVLGISVDSPESHTKFIKKYKLPFTLLSDEGKSVVRLYKVWGRKKFMGREYEGTLRTSFLVNPEGKISKIYKNVDPAIHAKEVLSDLKKIKRQ